MAKDIFHDLVKEALIKEGWLVTDDPLFLLSKEEGGISTDLGAEKILVAEKGLTKIAVEVKSFINPSLIHDFSKAVGQYIVYLDVLEMTKSERIMYLAMPFEVYNYLITKPYINYVNKKHNIKFILFDPTEKLIEKWIE
jgi:XisH protein